MSALITVCLLFTVLKKAVYNLLTLDFFHFIHKNIIGAPMDLIHEQEKDHISL